MKTFIAFVALATIIAVQGATLSDEQKQKLQTHHKECAAVSKLGDDVVEKYRKGEKIAETQELRDHLFCVSKKIGFMNEAGDFQKDVIKTKLSTIVKDGDALDKVIEKCTVKKENPAQTTYDSIKCFKENTTEHISIV